MENVVFERQINEVEGGGGGHTCPVMWWAGLLGRFKAGSTLSSQCPVDAVQKSITSVSTWAAL